MKLERVIEQIKKQGQASAILCYDNSFNRQIVNSLAIKVDSVYLIKNLEKIDIERIKLDKPDFLIVFFEEELITASDFIYDWGAKHIRFAEEITYMSRDVESVLVKVDKEIIFESVEAEIVYPADYSSKVAKYWGYLLENGKSYWDGPMYSVCNYKESPNSLCFEFAKTNYRNMIYSKEHDFRNEFHTCTTASIAMIETSDGYSVLGKMSKDSAFSGQYKCLGGTLDQVDFIGTRVDFQRMFSRELAEELGIDINDDQICLLNESKWLLIREEMAFVGLCNVIKLTLNKAELTESFRKHQNLAMEYGTMEWFDEKEVDSLLFIQSMDEVAAIPKSEKADYVDELFRCYFGLKMAMSWKDYSRGKKALDYQVILTNSI